jgi:hypothetical protein
MIRKFKALRGLALVAVFAMSAIAASAASASAGTLTTFPAGKTVVVTGEQIGEHAFTFTDHPFGGVFNSFKCKKAIFDGVGTVATGATSVTVTPTYSECTAFGQPVRITHNECNYVLSTGAATAGGWHVNTALSCPAGKIIEIHTGVCAMTIAAQGPLTTSEVTTSGVASPETGMDLLLHIKITGMTYTVTKDNIGCPLTQPVPKLWHKMDYEGTTTVKTLDSVTTVPVGITLH